ncbi:LuxR family transcriptional regulator [Paenibacillus athensensis]|uniref:HTH luxR-type domain-containing protein n=1 Tax=Paenibacillus athensensis TaxID=1967502 RepID=A0A4Y8Q002_9BACL|nr:LuxR C-terminal-related transcriptional regulator [Paenibacillus athensensis]MCD1261405.1 LuxR family transcriptional regulator [Paenibacillus athensensis]
MKKETKPHVTNEVLTTKLEKPPSRQLMVDRNHLIDLLHRGQDKRLSLVSAPAGFGKTTVVSQWASICDRPVAWLSLDERDNDVIRFLTYVIEAIRKVFPNLGNGILIALSSPQLPQINAVLSQLINELHTMQKAFTMVIDDYHLINNPSIEQGLSFLVAQMPSHMNVTIVSRDMPDLPLSKLRAKNQLMEIGVKDLRFTDIETACFLNQVMGLSLTKKNMIELEKRTEGWVTGLQLAALSIQGNKDVTCLLENDSFAGSHHFVMDYLFDEVLVQLPENILNFLMVTSMLDRFSAPLCDAILSNEWIPSGWNSQKTIEYLERKNLFIIPLDQERRWYRYHHLFAELLKMRFKKNREQIAGDQDIISKLHKRASLWYENNHFTLEAFYHAVEAKDTEGASRLVEGGGVPLLYRGAATPVLHWLESLPLSVLDANPSLRVLYATTLLFLGRVGEVEKILVTAENTLSSLPQNEKNNNLMGHISATRAAVAVSQNNLSRIMECSQHAIENLSPLNLPVLTATKWTLGFAHQMQGNHKLAREAYEEALRSSEAIGHFIITILASIGLGNIYEMENQLHLAKNSYMKVLNLDGHLAFPASAVAYLGLSRIAYEQDHMKEALDLIQEAIKLARHLNNMDTLTVCELLHAKINLAQGKIGETLKLLKQASQSLQKNNFSMNMYKVAQAEVLTRLHLHDIPSAQYLVQKYNLPNEQIRVHLAAGETDQALLKIESLTQASIEMLILRALTYFQAKEIEKAVFPLWEAIEIAKTEGHLRVFLDQGAPMEALLKAALRFEIMTDHINTLLLHFSTKHPSMAPLTQRELEVLRLIAQGFSNHEISKMLFVSLNTIKGHNQRIFSKLQVKSRAEAILRTHELRLL